MNRTSITIGLVTALLALSACGSDAGEPADLGEVNASAAEAGASAAPGDAIWVAVLSTGADEVSLQADADAAKQALGDYLADRVVIKDAACFEGLPSEMAGSMVVAIQDFAEHGVHAMYLEITDDPPFYGPATLAC